MATGPLSRGLGGEGGAGSLVCKPEACGQPVATAELLALLLDHGTSGRLCQQMILTAGLAEAL